MRTIIAGLMLMVLLQGCSARSNGDPHKLPPAAQPSPGETTPNPPPATTPGDPPQQPAAPPLAIESVTIPDGRPFADWTLISPGSLSVEVNATGAESVTLVVARYPGGPAMPPMQPENRIGDRYLFQVNVDAAGPSYLALVVKATQGSEIVAANRPVFMLKPQYTHFTTVAKGHVGGWTAEVDGQVRAIFREGAVYWFDDPKQYQAFGGRLNELVGLQLPAVELQGRTAIVLLGAPVASTRPFEAVQVDVPPGQPASVTPDELRILMQYAPAPAVPGKVCAPYQILLVDTQVYQRPGTLKVLLVKSPAPSVFAQQDVVLEPGS